MEFNDWLTRQFLKWCGNERRTITEFAEYLGVKQPGLSKWMKKGGGKPDLKNVMKIASKLGPDTYDILGLARPKQQPIPGADQFPPEMLRRLRKAGREIERVFRERNLTGEMPEAERMAIEIMEKHGFIWTHTEEEPDTDLK